MNYKKKLQKIINLSTDLQKYEGVILGKNVKTEPNVFFDTEHGPIVVGDESVIKSGAVLRGPLLIGKNCKVGGEVEHSILGDYSNKAHYGFLGHSYIGSWVNIGAGTSISNLKNTYSAIKMAGVDTGQQFLGCVIGDYCKTAINTSIFCGKVIGESSHLYGMVTEDVPAFTSHVSSRKMFELPLEIAKRIQTAMMKRRGKEFAKEDSELFDKLFKETEEDR
ncbi:MAG: hypothetical protein AAB815_01580, partial [Patescibacteria group bacterium]